MDNDLPYESIPRILHHPLVWVVTGVRIAGAFYIFLNPLWGFAITCFFDVIDAQIMLRIVKLSRQEYHLWDKNVDWLTYVIMLTAGATYGMFFPLFLLLFYRFLGQFMFMRSGRVVYFIFFPNFFEAAFLWLIIFHPKIEIITLSAAEPWVWLLVFFFLKQVQELSLHFVWPRILPIFEPYLYKNMRQGKQIK